MTVLLSPQAQARISNKIRAALLLVNSQGRAAHYTEIYRLVSDENPDNIGRILREYRNTHGVYWKDWTKGYFYLTNTKFEVEVVNKLQGKQVFVNKANKNDSEKLENYTLTSTNRFFCGEGLRRN